MKDSTEMALVLTRAWELDGRLIVGGSPEERTEQLIAKAEAWFECVGDLVSFDDAIEAVTRHYAETTERLMPAHLRGDIPWQEPVARGPILAEDVNRPRPSVRHSADAGELREL